MKVSGLFGIRAADDPVAVDDGAEAVGGRGQSAADGDDGDGDVGRQGSFDEERQAGEADKGCPCCDEIVELSFEDTGQGEEVQSDDEGEAGNEEIVEIDIDEDVLDDEDGQPFGAEDVEELAGAAAFFRGVGRMGVLRQGLFDLVEFYIVGEEVEHDEPEEYADETIVFEFQRHFGNDRPDAGEDHHQKQPSHRVLQVLSRRQHRFFFKYTLSYGYGCFCGRSNLRDDRF